MDRMIKSAIKRSFIPPPSKKREQFINSISFPKAKFSELVTSQIGFIRKRVWLLFIFCVCTAFLYAKFGSTSDNLVSAVSALLPFISLCIITELHISLSYNMEETELACKHSLPKITLIRLAILGTVSFAVLGLLVLIVGKSDFGTIRNTVYITVPFLLTCYISLFIITKMHRKETIYVCAAVSGIVSVFVIVSGGSFSFIYSAEYTFIWIILSILLTGLVIFRLIKYIKLQEELQCIYA